MSDISDAFDRVHPDFVDLLIRSNLLPGEAGDGLSESNLARLIYIALELAEEDEQIFLLSRIITEDELAVERLRSPEVRNTHHRVVLDRVERRVLFAMPQATLHLNEETARTALFVARTLTLELPAAATIA
jgi:hypothetical protein